jgi:hypothetical protein
VKGNELYIGDGVYVWRETDTDEIILETQRDEGKHWIALDRDGLDTLVEFAKREGVMP